MVFCKFELAAEMIQNLNEIAKMLKLPIDKISPFAQEDQIIDILHSLIIKIKEQLAKDQSGSNQPEGDKEGYIQIEKQLQRQQNINRVLIKKELEFKEYQKCLIEELDQQKTKTKSLKKELNKFSEEIQNKQIELALLSNQKKILYKERDGEKKVQKQSDKKITRDKKYKDFLEIQHFFNDKKISDFYKNEKSGFKPAHERRRSDEMTRRPATANLKKKSMSKK